MFSNSHFMNSRDAFAIAFDTHSAIMKHAESDNSSVNGTNIDAINQYYSLMMQFVSHNDFIDSCVFDSMVEIDNVLELIESKHDVFNWKIDDFVTHYQFDMRSMHHFKSLEIHGMEQMHNRALCVYCSTDIDMQDACCVNSRNIAIVHFTIADIF